MIRITRPLRHTLAVAVLALASAAAGAQSLSLEPEREPNDARQQAQRVPLGADVVAVLGAINRRGDVDVYRIDLDIGRCVGLVLTPQPLADHDLELLNSFGLVLASSENRGVAQIEVLGTCGLPLSQTYYLRVKRFSGPTGTLPGAYGLEIVNPTLLP